MRIEPNHPAAAYLRLSEGPDDLIDERRSRWHVAFAVAAVLIYLVIGFLLSTGLRRRPRAVEDGERERGQRPRP